MKFFSSSFCSRMLISKNQLKRLLGLVVLVYSATLMASSSHVVGKTTEAPIRPSEASSTAVDSASTLFTNKKVTQLFELPPLHSHAALVMHATDGTTVFQKNIDQQASIASITKMMTAMVILDAHLSMRDMITIAAEDVDVIKGSHSRLAVGTCLSRRELLLLAIMSSENRAAAALARTYPGGTAAFIEQMNKKAQDLNMQHTVFCDPTGLSPNNRSTANDLALMTKAAYRYSLIRDNSTKHSHEVVLPDGQTLTYYNSNPIVREGLWDIRLQKTGFTREAGRCMVAYAKIDGEPYIFVLLAARNNALRIQDARLLKTWLEQNQHVY